MNQEQRNALSSYLLDVSKGLLLAVAAGAVIGKVDFRWPALLAISFAVTCLVVAIRMKKGAKNDKF